jgi:hypothetical protein
MKNYIISNVVTANPNLNVIHGPIFMRVYHIGEFLGRYYWQYPLDFSLCCYFTGKEMRPILLDG